MKVQIVFAFLKCEYLGNYGSYEKEINQRYVENGLKFPWLKFGAKSYVCPLTSYSENRESAQSYV